MHLNETDRINDLMKLAMHRIAARTIPTRPEVIEEARKALAQMEDRFGDAPYIDEWKAILNLPESQLRRVLTQRSESMERLRKLSPFLSIPKGTLDYRDPVLRKRLWKIARQVVILRAKEEPDGTTRPRKQA